VAAITASKSDIIFLSDTRLTSSSGVRNDERTFNAFKDSKNRSYFFNFNSSKNARGVGILVANDLPYTTVDRVEDQDENFLLLKIEINALPVIVGAVYGPNNSDRGFFAGITRAINQLRNGSEVPVIIGGDWNTVWDDSPINRNIDVFSMAAIPNPQNSSFLHLMCNNYNLIDPFRILYPEKRDYSYQPFGTLRNNRSRLDFFCISENLLPFILKTDISSSVSCALFDHKSISLTLGTQKIGQNQSTLSNRYLGEPIYGMVVKSTAISTYLHAIDTSNANGMFDN